MVDIGQLLVAGVLIGLAYAILSVGFSLTWGVTGVVNISHPAWAVVAAYGGWAGQEWLGLDPLIALVGLLPLFYVLGWLFYRILVTKILAQARDSEMASLVITFGVAIVIDNVLLQAFSPDPRIVRTPYVLASIDLGPLRLQGGHLAAAALSIAVLVGLQLFLHKTYLGRAVRAVKADSVGAAHCGIDVRRATSVTYGLAFASAAAAGVALSFIYAFNHATYLSWLVVTFLVVIFGGVGSIRGVGLAALIVGCVLGLSNLVIPFAFVNLVLFAGILLLLLVRPSGLLTS